jgi:hypothetical protein
MKIGTSAGTGSMVSILPPTTSRPTYIDLRRSQSATFHRLTTIGFHRLTTQSQKSLLRTMQNSGLCALHSYALFENY